MSSAEVLSAVKSSAGHSLNQPPKTNNHVKPPNSNSFNKRKNKHERLRKRSKSFSGCGGMPINQKPVLPSKFLLGGNIKDPLNLNSLQDEEINRAMNAVTPKSSPVPTPPRKRAQIEVIIPKNIRDPLGLIDQADDAEYEQELCPPPKKPKKKRPKKRRTISGSIDLSLLDSSTASSEAITPEATSDSAKIPELPVVTPEAPVASSSSSASASAKDLSLDLPAAASAAAAAVPEATASAAPGKKEKPKRKSEDHHHHHHQHPAKKFKANVDKIVSPVVPQPGAWLKRSNSVNKPKQHRPPKGKDEELQMPVFKERDKQFQYGNYNRYYGYRNPNNEVDHRLRVFSHHAYMFGQRDILDIGCNIGHITLSIARDFGAKSVTGVDIDPKLIAIARKNVRHYVKTTPTEGASNVRGGKSHRFRNKRGRQSATVADHRSTSKSSFNDSGKGEGFPDNVTFKQCNYILENDGLLELEQPQFDVILCLSITKWIHLNWGDDGIKQAFRRMYAQLRPGGKLILEPQNWSSYKGKKKLTETIYRNYNTIEFFPDKFREYLLSPAVGFAKSEILGYPPHHSKGFRRPIQVFTKSTMFPSERVEATPQSITPLVGSYSSSERLKTDNYVPQMRLDNVEHVYTDLLDSRYCGSAEESAEINEKLGEELSGQRSSSGMEDVIEGGSRGSPVSERLEVTSTGTKTDSNRDETSYSPQSRLCERVVEETSEKMICTDESTDSCGDHRTQTSVYSEDAKMTSDDSKDNT